MNNLTTQCGERLFYAGFFVAVLMWLVLPGAAAAQTVETFTTPGASTWTAPANVYEVIVECWGGGGGGAGDGNNDALGPAGGGGGGYARSLVSVTPGLTYSYSVGAGGAGASNSDGAAGGSSLFNSTACIATGGGGGTGSAGGAGTPGAVGTGTGNAAAYSGGSGSAGSGSTGGGGGSSAGTAAAGNSASGATGGSAPAGGGAGANGQANGVNGAAGTTPGGGGSASGNRAGGAEVGGSGAAGQVRLTYEATTEITYGGTVYVDAGLSTTSETFTVRMAVSTSSPSNVYATTTVNGQFSFELDILSAGITPTTTVVIWVDGATTKATTIFKPGGLSSYEDIHLWSNHVKVRNLGLSEQLALSDLLFYDSTLDGDILYTATATPNNILTILGATTTFYIWEGSSFYVDGDVTLPGNFIAGTNSVFTTNSTSTLQFVSTTTGRSVTGVIGSVGNILFNGLGGSWTFTEVAITSSDFTVGTGTVTVETGSVVIGGDFINNATFNAPAVDVLYVAGNFIQNGIFDANAGTVAFIGPTVSIIEGDLTGSNALYDVVATDESQLDFQVATATLNTLRIDGVGGERESYAALTNTASLPTGAGTGVAFSEDGVYLSVSHFVSPYVTIYKREGDVFTKLANPGVLPPGAAYGTTFSPDGQYLVVGHDFSPFVTIYKREGDTFTKLANPASLPVDTGNDLSFSPDGQYLSVAHYTSPFITIYKRSGDTFTKLANPATLPTGDAFGTSFSPDGQYLSVTHAVSPFVTIYKREGDTFTKLANPATLPADDSNSTSFSPDGQYLSVAHAVSPFVTIYKRSGDTFTKLANPATLPPSAGVGTTFSPDGQYLSVTYGVSPFITIYKQEGDTFNKITDPTGATISAAYDAAFSSDSRYLAVGLVSSPYVKIYRKNPSAFVNGPDNLTLTGSLYQFGSIEFSDTSLQVSGLEQEILQYLSGLEAGSGVSSGFVTVFQKIGDTLYVGRSANTGTCVPATAAGCELLIFDVSSTTNPVYITGRESGSGSAGSTILKLFYDGNVLYVGRASYAGTCASATAVGCEILVYDVSSSSNPVYLAGMEITGNATALAVRDGMLFAGTGSNNTECIPATGVGCEIFVFDVTAPSSPSYLTGIDYGVLFNGFALDALVVRAQVLYVGRSGGYGGTCNEGTGADCELLVYDISSPSNPTYITGREVGQEINTLEMRDNALYVGNVRSLNSECDPVTGEECAFKVFDITDTTNPIFVKGIAPAVNTSVSFRVSNDTLYVVNDGADGCNESTGFGCRLQIYDISNALHPTYLTGKAVPSTVYDVHHAQDTIFVGGANAAGACDSVTRVGCEILLISSLPSSGIIAGLFTDGNVLGNVSLSGVTSFFASAASIDTLVNSGTTSLPNQISVRGDLVNDGSMSFESFLTAAAFFIGTTSQTISGNITDSNALPQTTVASGAVVTAENALTTHGFTNAGTFTALAEHFVEEGSFINTGSIDYFESDLTLHSVRSVGDYITGREGGSGTAGESVRDMLTIGNTLYIGADTNAGTCVPATGVGCEILVYDISSSTNPTYLTGLESGSGSDGGTVMSLALSGTTLYVGRINYTGTCNTGTSAGCELLVYDVSTPTSPSYVTGREMNASSAGVYDVSVDGNGLFIALGGSSTACVPATGEGCEVFIFDISTPGNPSYVTGLEMGSAFVPAKGIVAHNNVLYVGRSGGFGTCVPSTGSGCDLMAYDISVLSNPTLVAGQPLSSRAVDAMKVIDDTLYVMRYFSGGLTCNFTNGDACSIVIFDISSSTSITYLNSIDVQLASLSSIAVLSEMDLLYIGSSEGTRDVPCDPENGNNCELMIYDITSRANPVYLTGRGGRTTNISALATYNDVLYAGLKVEVFNGACNTETGQDCELKTYILEDTKEVSGYAPGVSARGNIHITGGRYEFNTDTSVNDLVITGSTIVAAPGNLTVTGDFLQSAMFDANNGNVLLTGTNQTVTSLATTTFFNFTKEVTSADTLTFATSSRLEFAGELTLNGVNGQLLSLRSASSGEPYYFNPLATTTVSYLNVQDSFNTATETIVCGEVCVNSGNNTNWSFAEITDPSLSSGANQQFSVNQASTTLNTITITEPAGEGTITAVNDIRITIASSTKFNFTSGSTTPTFGGTAAGKVSATVSFEDDATTLVVDVITDFAPEDTLTISDINVGNFYEVSTTSGNLSLYTNGSTVGSPAAVDPFSIIIIGVFIQANHVSGQVSNAFVSANESNETLFAFQLNPNGSVATSTDVVLSLLGAQHISNQTINNWRLYVDENNDRLFDGGDTLVDGVGIMTINGQNGAVTFSTDFSIDEVTNYIVVADFSGVGLNSQITIALLEGGVVLENGLVAGAVDSVQHLRPRTGMIATGGSAPAGRSVVSGGNNTGGEPVEDSTSGDNITPNANYRRPTVTGNPDNEWTNGVNALISNNIYATAASALRQSFSSFGLVVPSGNEIEGIAIRVDASGTSAAGTLDIALSWDGGASYTTAKATPVLGTNDIVYSVGGPSDVWGRAWSASEFNDQNFRLRITAAPSENTLRLDGVEVRVYSAATNPGGGGGGGSAID